MAEELFEEVLRRFQLRSHEAALLLLSLTDINNGDELVRQTIQNVSHCFDQQEGSQQDEKCQFLKLFGSWSVLGEYFDIFVLDTKEAQTLINHPVHLLDPETGSLSPSAFIPFCDFAGDMTELGRKIPEFALPVCTSFTRTFIEGQLCYELEVNKFFNEPRSEQKLRRGLTLILDYNEDRNLVRIRGKEMEIKQNLVDNIVSFEESQKALIYIKTISKRGTLRSTYYSYFLYSAPIKMYGEGHYAIGVAKALEATQSFLRLALEIFQKLENISHQSSRLAESVTGCQSRASREE